MKNFWIEALIESVIFALCCAGLTALIHLFMGNRMSSEEVFISLPLLAIGWFIWKVIKLNIDKKKQ